MSSEGDDAPVDSRLESVYGLRFSCKAVRARTVGLVVQLSEAEGRGQVGQAAG